MIEEIISALDSVEGTTGAVSDAAPRRSSTALTVRPVTDDIRWRTVSQRERHWEIQVEGGVYRDRSYAETVALKERVENVLRDIRGYVLESIRSDMSPTLFVISAEFNEDIP